MGKTQELFLNARADTESDYKFRIVVSRERLLEKLEIFDAGLDDRIVEVEKILLSAGIMEKYPDLSNFNLGQLQIILVLAGLLSILAAISCTLFLSAKCKDSLTVLLISIVMLFMPLFAYAALGANWISSILPSAGIGMQNNFLYQLMNFNYLHIGQMSFWTPHVILVSAAVEIPIFLFLTVRSYNKHQVA